MAYTIGRAAQYAVIFVLAGIFVHALDRTFYSVQKTPVVAHATERRPVWLVPAPARPRRPDARISPFRA